MFVTCEFFVNLLFPTNSEMNSCKMFFFKFLVVSELILLFYLISPRY